jgi:hypothetical protein
MRNRFYFTAILAVVFAGLAATNVNAQHKHDSPQCPMNKQQMAEMNKRGDQGMGFSQEKTTHHFYLTKTGGVIQVEANDAKDTASRDQIREHLGHIAMMFAEGNFDTPMFVHDQIPGGVNEMQRLKTAISYKFEETKQGGRVLIWSADPQAVSAVQSFLRFQITEHKTGDPLEVSRK